MATDVPAIGKTIECLSGSGEDVAYPTFSFAMFFFHDRGNADKENGNGIASRMGRFLPDIPTYTARSLLALVLQVTDWMDWGTG